LVCASFAIFSPSGVSCANHIVKNIIEGDYRIPIAVNNARSEVLDCCVYVTQAKGGHGAIREVVDWLLKLRGQKEEAIKKVLQH